jgi:hypothetical protein
LSATPAPQPACWWLATTPRSDSTLQYIAIPHKTVPTSNGCPLQQWTEGQPLPAVDSWKMTIQWTVQCYTFNLQGQTSGGFKRKTCFKKYNKNKATKIANPK